MSKFEEFSQKVKELQKEYKVFIDTIVNDIGTDELIVVDEATDEFKYLFNEEADDNE